MAQTKNQFGEQIEATRKQSSDTLVQMRNQQQKQLEGERLAANRLTTELRDKSHDSYQAMQVDGEKRRNQLDKNQSQQLKLSRERFLETNEKVEKEYSNETQRVQSEGEDEINSRKTEIGHDLKKQDDLYKTETKARRELAQKDEKKANAELRAKIDERAKLQDATLKAQQHDFDTKRNRNEDTNKTSLQNQREKYAQALYAQQREYDGKYDKIQAREEDPFYALQSFDAHLEDHDDHYIVRAQVPPHEREKVDIRVQDGKVAFSASRQIEQKRDDEGVKVASNSYQTWRQDIPLRMPIHRDAVTKTISPEGEIVVRIPKKF